MKRVLILGSGGREHALAYGLHRANLDLSLWLSPGNVGATQQLGAESLAVTGDSPTDRFDNLMSALERLAIDTVFVGPEQWLVDGVVDHLDARGFDRVFGPTQAAAQLESDKFFSFDVMAEAAVPQAKGKACRDTAEIHQAVNELASDRGVVLKARGLAAGKGVIVCDSADEALRRIPEIQDTFGPDVLVSERLSGPEFSLFAVVRGDDSSVIPMAAQDYKRQRDDDEGPNTGGMGVYTPVPWVNADLQDMVAKTVIQPTLNALKQRGISYRGFLYAGMMLTDDGPKVIEFNVRFGDPEAQVIIPLLKGRGFVDSIEAALSDRETLPTIETSGAACGVVLAATDYPERGSKGAEIAGLDTLANRDDTLVFHNGTRLDGNRIVTSGGRLLTLVGLSAKDVEEARANAYAAVRRIHVEGGMRYRTDIAKEVSHEF